MDWFIYTHGGRRVGLESSRMGEEAKHLVLERFCLTSMNEDGEKSGFDIAINETVRDAISIPVTASGGAGNVEHFYNVFTETNVDAALAASIFHYKETSIQKVKECLERKECSRCNEFD